MGTVSKSHLTHLYPLSPFYLPATSSFLCATFPTNDIALRCESLTYYFSDPPPPQYISSGWSSSPFEGSGPSWSHYLPRQLGPPPSLTRIAPRLSSSNFREQRNVHKFQDRPKYELAGDLSSTIHIRMPCCFPSSISHYCLCHGILAHKNSAQQRMATYNDICWGSPDFKIS